MPLSIRPFIRHRRPWCVEYDDTGGYDCMTGAFFVLDAGRDIVAVVDLARYGQDRCGVVTETTRATAHGVALAIVDAVNAIPRDPDGF